MSITPLDGGARCQLIADRQIFPKFIFVRVISAFENRSIGSLKWQSLSMGSAARQHGDDIDEALLFWRVARMLSRLKWRADQALRSVGLLPSLTWADVKGKDDLRLYAGALTPDLAQYYTHVGLNPYRWSEKSIRHDITKPIPLPDNRVSVFQSEDVFEHIEYDLLPAVFAEIYRVLKPGGLFRLSLPDYRVDFLRERCLKNERGELVHDPDGGGRYLDGKVIDGGHVWLPTIEKVQALFDGSPFKDVRVLHATMPNGNYCVEPIDYSLGFVQRTPDNDPRAQSPYRPFSIVVDAYK